MVLHILAQKAYKTNSYLSLYTSLCPTYNHASPITMQVPCVVVKSLVTLWYCMFFFITKMSFRSPLSMIITIKLSKMNIPCGILGHLHMLYQEFVSPNQINWLIISTLSLSLSLYIYIYI